MNKALIKNLESQIKLKDFKLNSLLEITNAINSNEDVDKIIDLYAFILREQLGYDRFILFNRQKKWNCLLKVGYKGRVNHIDVAFELSRFEEITTIQSSHSKFLSDFDVIVPVDHKGQTLAYLLVKGSGSDEKYLNAELSYMSFIQTLTNIIVVAIENKRMVKLKAKQERYKKELELAKTMQQLLFPEELPSDKCMDISAKYKPRHEVGGDYYDFIPVGEDEYIICIADVSGKGISAAMLMANFQATLRTLVEYQEFDLKALIVELNKKVMNSAKGEKFITFFLAHYNTVSRKLAYVNAGHNHPFITNGKEVANLDQGCIGLGMLDELPFINVGEKELEPNTTIVLYTDGVVELENEAEAFFGTDRLIKL
ncbi:MAG: PP2C family protein-serine/threonine phosphatase, partial [Crocinitomicaceae bacterium]|nr:PP2C family protein-serine/threonine phosphatase [Crocinitomicaceae bacterium]